MTYTMNLRSVDADQPEPLRGFQLEAQRYLQIDRISVDNTLDLRPILIGLNTTRSMGRGVAVDGRCDVPFSFFVCHLPWSWIADYGSCVMCPRKLHVIIRGDLGRSA